MNTRTKILSLSAIAIAMTSGVNVSWTPQGTLIGAIALPATAAGKSDDQSIASTFVEKAQCGPSDKPETGLQGQIPMPDRLTGFKGFNCNLQLTGSTSASLRAEGIWQQFAYARDRAGHVCGYGGGTFFSGNPGTVVVDLTDPTRPVETVVLTTAGMITPGEGLRAHQGRGLLVSGNYGTNPRNTPVTHGFDVYDIGVDCRHPQLLVSTTSLQFDTTGLPQYPGNGPWPNPDSTYGHEGAFAPDGMTYYEADVPHALYHAIDLTDPTKPKLLASFHEPDGSIHGLSISTDGKRAYLASVAFNFAAPGGATPVTGFWPAGFIIIDTSEVQERKPNPTMRLIGTSYYNDSSITQMTIPVKIKGKNYLITSEEAAVGQLNARGQRTACAQGRTPFGMARIHDIEDETSPKTVAKIVLEVNNPANCALVDPEIGAVNGFVYDVHMCSVDNRQNATTLACSYFQSGIRVYDIRDPLHVKEIAYFTPAAKSAGAGLGFAPGSGGPGWCAAIPFVDKATGMLYSSCVDTGIVALKFTNDVWPLNGSSTPPDKQL